MGKITRFIGNLAAFASAASGTNRTIFGPKGTAIQSDDITTNINPDYLGGWELLGPSDKPTKQQFNALGFTHGQLLSYLHQMGVAEWDGSQEYQIGSIANRAGVLYSCKTADHVSVTPPESDSANWIQTSMKGTDAYVVNYGSNANGTYRAWSDGTIEQWGVALTVSANVPVTVTLPIAFSGNPNRYGFATTQNNAATYATSIGAISTTTVNVLTSVGGQAVYWSVIEEGV